MGLNDSSRTEEMHPEHIYLHILYFFLLLLLGFLWFHFWDRVLFPQDALKLTMYPQDALGSLFDPPDSTWIPHALCFHTARLRALWLIGRHSVNWDTSPVPIYQVFKCIVRCIYSFSWQCFAASPSARMMNAFRLNFWKTAIAGWVRWSVGYNIQKQSWEWVDKSFSPVPWHALLRLDVCEIKRFAFHSCRSRVEARSMLCHLSEMPLEPSGSVSPGCRARIPHIV